MAVKVPGRPKTQVGEKGKGERKGEREKARRKVGSIKQRWSPA